MRRTREGERGRGSPAKRRRREEEEKNWENELKILPTNIRPLAPALAMLPHCLGEVRPLLPLLARAARRPARPRQEGPSAN